MSLLDLADPLERAVHELVVDLGIDQRAAGAGADFALIEGEHGKAFETLVEIIVVLVHHIGEEDVRRLAAEFQRPE
jgi:ParB family chromosome partitioning protein